jgi:hypothetical protein
VWCRVDRVLHLIQLVLREMHDGMSTLIRRCRHGIIICCSCAGRPADTSRNSYNNNYAQEEYDPIRALPEWFNHVFSLPEKTRRLAHLPRVPKTVLTGINGKTTRIIDCISLIT